MLTYFLESEFFEVPTFENIGEDGLKVVYHENKGGQEHGCRWVLI